MNVIKATDEAVNAIRKMSSVSRSLISTSIKKQSSFMAENSKGYSGPFMVSYNDPGTGVYVSSPPEYVGGNTQYAGSILAPDMQIVTHIPADGASYTAGQENTLLVLVVTWRKDGSFGMYFDFVPDPWKTCSDENRLIAADFVNPKNETYPYRDPFISIYPIARMEENKIIQIQRGHIVEYNRWWRV